MSPKGRSGQENISRFVVACLWDMEENKSWKQREKIGWETDFKPNIGNLIRYEFLGNRLVCRQEYRDETRLRNALFAGDQIRHNKRLKSWGCRCLINPWQKDQMFLSNIVLGEYFWPTKSKILD